MGFGGGTTAAGIRDGRRLPHLIPPDPAESRIHKSWDATLAVTVVRNPGTLCGALRAGRVYYPPELIGGGDE